jgi:hypothetical protein
MFSTNSSQLVRNHVKRLAVPLLTAGCPFSRRVSFAIVLLSRVQFDAAEFGPSLTDPLVGFVLPFSGP